MSARNPLSQPRARRRRLFAPALGLGLVCAMLTLVGTPAASDSGEARAAMADAMSRMMEAMGFLGSGAESARSMASGQMPGLSGMPGWGMPGSMGMPGWPGMSAPFGSGDPMSQAGRMGEALMEQMPQGIPGMPPGAAMPQMPSMPWSGGLLQGVWEGASGGVLIVQGPYYRLYSPTGGFIDGRLELRSGELRLYNPSAGFDRRFDYALDQGRMALRDEGGQVYLYRQLVLDGGEGSADQPSPR
jgi:hypothetical protein